VPKSAAESSGDKDDRGERAGPRRGARRGREEGKHHAGRARKGRAARLHVLVIRHAVAEERWAFAKRSGEPDAQRPLTKPGRRKMRRAARGLARVVPELTVLAASPLTRAAQTAEIVAERYGGMRTVTVAPLAPGKPAGALLTWLGEQHEGAVVAIVGHEPDLGQFVSWALTGLRESFVPLKKGAACLLEFPGEVRPGRARLLWLLKPSQLRAIGEG
jgi:phosphohistidine phosphatase